MTLSTRVFQKVRSFSVGTQIDLFQIDLTSQGGSIFYFTNNVMQERHAIQFGGNTYTYLPVSFDEPEVDAHGSPAQPRLSLATAGGPVSAMLQQYNDMRGCNITRMCTFAEFLDVIPSGDGINTMANPSADATAIIRSELYVIDQKEGSDNISATFLCVSPMDVEGAMLPRRIVRKRFCDAMYRVYDSGSGTFVTWAQVDGGCPYRGTAYFDEFDQPTTIDKDRCSKQVSGCLRRYGYQNGSGNWVTNVGLPAQLFPGVRTAEEAG